jgi:hypothetical protein
VKDRFTDEFVEHIRKALPWMSRLSIFRDDLTNEWSAGFLRGGEECYVELGPELPRTPSEFCKYIKKGLAVSVDRTKMDALEKELEHWEDADD